MKANKANRMQILLALALFLPALILSSNQDHAQSAHAAQSGQRIFAETGKTVQGKFLEYWEKNGGLVQQGFPISSEMQEQSATDGKTYTVQYFERAVFELHPENAPPNDVLLSLLGVFSYSQRYPNGAPAQVPNDKADSHLFTDTGKRVGGLFLDYWNRHGGLAQQGFPISDEFNELSSLDGKTYKVQYFERAVFEYHPENQPPSDVLLSQLGTFRYRDKYLQPVAPTEVPPTSVPPIAEPSPTPATTEVPQPAEYAAVRAKFENMTPDQWKAAGYTSANPCDPGIGVRIFNQALFEAQFNSRIADPQNPPILFADYTVQKIIGLQWAVPGDTKPIPVLFGQQMFIVAPGGETRYALFSWFKPDGYVRFALADPTAKCRL